MDASRRTRADLTDLITRAQEISSDRDEDVEEALRAGREERIDAGATKLLQSRVVRVMSLGAAGKDDPDVPRAAEAVRPAPARPRWMHLPYRALAIAALIAIGLPLLGYLVSAPERGTATPNGKHVQVFPKDNQAINTGKMNQAGSFPNHLVTVTGSSINTDDFAWGEARQGDLGRNSKTGSQKPGSSSGLTDIIQTDNLTIRVKPKTAESAAGKAAGFAAGVRGRVVAQTHQGTNSVVTMTVSVPSGAFYKVLRQLRAMGAVEYEDLSSQDVGLQVANLGAKIQNYQSQRAILLALFNKATTVKSTISVQQVLSNVQSQIDQLQSQQRYLASRISQAAISITFVTHKPSTPLPVKKSSTTNPVVKAIERAGTAAINVVAGVILLIGYALPLAILGLIGWGILVLVRRRVSARHSVA